MHEVAVVALDGVLPLDLAIPAQIFAARPDTPYRATMCGESSRVRTASGFEIDTAGSLESISSADTVVVAGYLPHDRAVSNPVIEALATAHRRGRRMVSICTGAFALGAAGVLDGHRSTTHWHHTDDLARLFPLTEVEPDVLFVEDGSVFTSAGMCCGIDLCLNIIRRDLGASVANTVARDLVAPPRRDGGQAQYIDRPTGHGDTTSLASTRDWALSKLSQPIDIPALARHARCSERSLARRFLAETGMPPGRWIATARLDHARELLESTDLAIDDIAYRCGLGTATNLRLHFRRYLATTPTAYRRTFTRCGP